MCNMVLRVFLSSQATSAITKEECMRELRRINQKHGRLSYSELQKVSSISVSTIFRRFGTSKINVIWKEVLKNDFMRWVAKRGNKRRVFQKKGEIRI